MSTGETPPSATARFTSPSSTISNTSNKKYPGTPKSPMLNTNTIGNRNSQTRQRLLASKISAPRPMNLPSLRREHAVGTEVPASSPSTSHGWGSSTSSPSLPQTTEINKPAEPNVIKSPVIKPVEPIVESTKVDPASSPPLDTLPASTVRAWAVPSASKPTTQPPTTDFPTAAEAAAKKTALLYDDKEYLKYAASDPNHTSWDEMVSEDLEDFQVDVVEFDDGTKVQVDSNEETLNAVSPSDRFTEDYDRSYPPRHHNESSDHGYHKPTYRRSEDHGYNSRYNNNNSSSNYDNRRHSNVATSAPSNYEERRTSNTTTERWTRRESSDTTRLNTNRRSSYDRKSTGPHPPVYNNSNNISTTSSVYHPTLLQRPRRLSEQSFRSDHSREDHVNPLQIISEPNSNVQPNESAAEITAAQREVMLTAAERAKKRRDEEEAEFEAARIRARQKADALARLAEAKKEPEIKKESESKMEPESRKEPESKKELDVKKEPEVKKDIERKSTKVKSLSPSPPPTSSPSSVLDKKESKTSISSSSATSTNVQKHIEPAPLPDTSKPWNLVAAKKEIVIAKRPSSTKLDTKETKGSITESSSNDKKEEEIVPTVDKNGKPLSKDEQNWEVFVSKVKTDAPIPKSEVAANDWNSFAVRLQKSVIDNQASFNAKNKANNNADKIVEVVDYTQNEEWGTIPSHITEGRSHDRGWTRNDEEHGGNGRNSYNNNNSNRGRGTTADRGGRGGSRGGRGRGGIISRTSTSSNTHYNQTQFDTPNSNDYWRQPDTDEQKQPVVTEILKHEPIVEKLDTQETPEASVITNITAVSKKTRLTNLLKESKSPIFPNFIEKLAVKKPANMSFMVDTDESDKDITMMDQVITTETQSIEEEHNIVDESVDNSITIPDVDESVDNSIAVPDVDKNNVNVPETTDETSTTSSTTSTPPRTQFHHTKNDNSRKMNVNPNYPVLVYQYPISQQTQNTEDARFKGVQQRPAGVYLMPQQQYVTSNQYMVSYPQVGTGVQPVYYPTLSWQQQQHPYNSNSTPSPRPHYEQRRPYNNNFKQVNNAAEWESNNGYQSHRYDNNTSNYRRGNSYRKRGGWSHSTNPRGRGNHAYQPRRYPDSPSPLPSSSTDNL